MAGCGLKCVDNTLKRLFFKLGVFIARHPGYFIIVPILLTIICITGFQRIFFEMDPEYLFSPQHGPGKTERAIVEQYFKMNYSARFNPTRITRPGRYIPE
ncbi:patched domain-containing protein 1-like [Diaphorina citri]|uniref:Patched domain-containing protein 1-like n=1 Tax=Diaphorina citri TaxID=121845 RepID=A0A3Q0JBQ4_DIACI|nr:patched domain-containing protein 1-like [Diaphorina citri]